VRSFGDGRYPAVYRRSSAPCRAAVWYHGKLADSRLEVDVRMPAERREFGEVERLSRGAPFRLRRVKDRMPFSAQVKDGSV